MDLESILPVEKGNMQNYKVSGKNYRIALCYPKRTTKEKDPLFSTNWLGYYRQVL